MGSAWQSGGALASRATFGWAETARALLTAQKVALVTILATQGSTPLGPGARMVVTHEGLAAGSVGGGALEATSIAQARAILDHAPGTWRVQDYPLGPLLGQCCGGKVRLMVEHLDAAQAGWLGDLAPGRVVAARLSEQGVIRTVVSPAEAPPLHDPRSAKPVAGDSFAEPLNAVSRPVLVFGAGHVGLALSAVLAPLPLALAWYDNRPEFARPGASICDEPQLLEAISVAAPEAAILIMTHDHGLDYRLALAAMRRPFALVGVIGSATKRARFLSRMERDGVADARERLVCPIGVAGIHGKDPAVIAIAVAAQLLMLETV